MSSEDAASCSKESGAKKPKLDMDKEEKIFKDPVHGSIKLNGLLVKIIDTPQFQRLRYIKQLGGGYFVYPGASHNRFEHSIGTAHLAGELVRSLRDQQPELKLTDEDILCAEIAGLCHDLGHGPFSHAFDNRFIPKARPGRTIKHEDLSLKMFDHMIEVNGLDKHFQEYGLDLEKDKIFIKEMIKPNDVTKGWTHKGREKDKSFMYELISNKETGVDVDKWDYFARDCYHFGWSSNFDHRRCIQVARVIECGEGDKRRRICFRDKEAHNMYDMFYTRYRLHRKAYQHKTCNIIEHMIVEAMVLAKDIVKVTGKDGKQVKLSEAVEDMYAYSNLNDSIFHKILFSTSNETEPARKILQNIEKREIYKLAGEESMKNIKEDFKDKENAVKEEVVNLCTEKYKSCIRCNTVIEFVEYDYGKKKDNPISSMYFYRKNEPNEADKISKEEVSLFLPDTFSEKKIRAYVKSEDLKKEVKNALKAWCKQKEKQEKEKTMRGETQP